MDEPEGTRVAVSLQLELLVQDPAALRKMAEDYARLVPRVNPEADLSSLIQSLIMIVSVQTDAIDGCVLLSREVAVRRRLT